MEQNLSCKDVVWSITRSSFGGEFLLVNLDLSTKMTSIINTINKFTSQSKKEKEKSTKPILK